MENSTFSDDQTFFSEEEPLFNESKRKRSVTPLVQQTQKKSAYFFVGAIAFIFISITVALVVTRQNGTTSPPQVTVTPTPIPQTSTQIDILMAELKAAVETADPTVNSLPFPPVLEEIKISQ